MLGLFRISHLAVLLAILCLPVFAGGDPKWDRGTILGGRQDCTIGFTRVYHLIIVQVELAGSNRKHCFILDTGAGMNMVSKRIIRELKAEKMGQTTLADGVGNKGMADTYKLDYIELGECRVRNSVTLVSDTTDLSRRANMSIDGVIGDDFLRNYRVTIDYQRSRVTLSQSREPISGMYVVRARPRAQYTTFSVPIAVSGEVISAEVDTGAKEVFIPVSVVKRFDWPQGEKICCKGSAGWSFLGKSSEDYFVRVRELALGKLRIRDYPARSTSEHCLLGCSLLSHFIVTIDYPNNTLVLNPYGKLRFDDNFSTAGLAVDRDARGETTITGVWENSPADKLGLKPGDKILEVNSRPALGYTLGDIVKLLLDDSTSSLDMQIGSDGRRRHVRMEKANVFPTIPN